MTETEHVEALVIGAGRSGPAAGYLLAARGRPHVVLVRGRVGETWLGTLGPILPQYAEFRPDHAWIEGLKVDPQRSALLFGVGEDAE